MNLDTYSHLIFDLDETIARLHIDWSGWHVGMQRIFQEFDPNYVWIKTLTHEALNDQIHTHGEEMRRRLWAYNEWHEGAYLTGLTPFTQIINLLQNTMPHQKKYLLTSNARRTVEPVLRQLQIESHFEKVVTRDDLPFIKPNPHAFTHFRQPGVALTEYIMIGDSSADMNFAKNSGIAFLNMRDVAV